MPLAWEFDLEGSRLTSSVAGNGGYVRTARATGITAASVPDMLREVNDDPGRPPMYSVLSASWPFFQMTSYTIDRLVCSGADIFARCTFNYTEYSITLSANDDGPVILTLSAGLSQEIVSQDRDGNPMTTTYLGETRAAEVEGFVPVTTYICRRIESTNPKARAETYVGKLNSGSWNGRADRTVLCEAIDTESRDGNDYQTTYRFQWRPDGWDPFIVHKERNGDPIQSPVLGTSLKQVELLTAVSFAPLNISF